MEEVISRFLFVFGLLAATTAAPITGRIELDGPDFQLSWKLSNASAAGQGEIEFTLDWRGGYDWAAFGLHPKPGSGMPNAEIFMCNPSSNDDKFCQVRYTENGYNAPEISPSQYIKLISSSRDPKTGTAQAVFSRPVLADSASKISYQIGYNTTMGLIYARGAWQQGNPIKHDGTAGRSEVNFFNNSPEPGPPTPAPTPAAKKAGVWPSRHDANMTIAMSQPVKDNRTLTTGLRARLRYDFPARSQLWEYFDMETRAPVGGELWIDEILYSFDGKDNCAVTNMTFDIISPNWLQGTHYASTNFLLRQSVSKFTEEETACNFSDYTLSDLFQLPNTIAMTNSWLVVDSPIAEPIRLEGPDDFNEPTYRSILEYRTFKPVSKFDASVFAIPAPCKQEALRLFGNADRESVSLPQYKGGTHTAFFWNLARETSN
eukprot:jgi/Bigna1/85927/estExt_fgenesh1_pg.C_70035